jgi:SSS family solute:Na+ symporter
MVFSILYAPVIEKFGGIFIYFQTASTYLAVPVATCFLFGMFWKRTTPAAALTVMIAGIPLGVFIDQVIIPFSFSAQTITAYGLSNFYVLGGITQVFCAIIIIAVSLFTAPKKYEEVASLIWSRGLLKIPASEVSVRPRWQSVWIWWCGLVVVYAIFYYLWW